jgi:hypothetical protein
MDRQTLQLISTAHKHIATSKISQERSNEKIARARILIERSNVRIAKNVSVGPRDRRRGPLLLPPHSFPCNTPWIFIIPQPHKLWMS